MQATHQKEEAELLALSSTLNNREEVLKVHNKPGEQVPLVVALDFDGTEIYRRAVADSEAALALARDESYRVDSAYALIGGRIHFFRFGLAVIPRQAEF